MPKDCLLLNGNGKPVSYFPLSTLDWKTAIKLIFTRNVVIVKNHEEEPIQYRYQFRDHTIYHNEMMLQEHLYQPV